jgi:drug/metabolite transporter (DMT)-like permease
MLTQPPPDNRRGIVAMLLAMAFFVANDAMVKLAREGLQSGQVMTVRGLFAIAITVGVVLWVGEFRRVRLMLRRRLLFRGLVELSLAGLYIVALGHLPLADLSAILQSTPIIMALWLAVTGAERMGWRRWTAVVVGFLGVLLVVRPGGGSFDVYAIIAFVSAALVAVRDLTTRRFGSEVPTVLILLSTVLMVTAGGATLSLFEEWRPMSAPVVALLAAAAGFVVLGNYAVITAFRNVEIAVVSPFRYSVILWAALAGFLVFGEIPDLMGAAGALLIVASGVYTVHRERLRANKRDLGIKSPSHKE